MKPENDQRHREMAQRWIGENATKRTLDAQSLAALLSRVASEAKAEAYEEAAYDARMDALKEVDVMCSEFIDSMKREGGGQKGIQAVEFIQRGVYDLRAKMRVDRATRALASTPRAEEHRAAHVTTLDGREVRVPFIEQWDDCALCGAKYPRGGRCINDHATPRAEEQNTSEYREASKKLGRATTEPAPATTTSSPVEAPKSRALSVVAGDRLPGSIEEHVRACESLILDEQEKPLPDNAIIGTLCNAVRMSREYLDVVKELRATIAALTSRVEAAEARVKELEGAIDLANSIHNEDVAATEAAEAALIHGVMTEGMRALESAMGMRAGKHTADSVARRAVSHLAAVTLRAEAAEKALHWEDVDDEWTAAIDAAHPTRSGSHETYAVAMKMVGHRHSKGELVALVSWLLGRAEAAERERDELSKRWSVAEDLARYVLKSTDDGRKFAEWVVIENAMLCDEHKSCHTCRLSTRADAAEHQVKVLREALAACGTGRSNPDDCGVCGDSITECDRDIRADGTPVCPGVQARALSATAPAAPGSGVGETPKGDG